MKIVEIRVNISNMTIFNITGIKWKISIGESIKPEA